MAKIVEKPIAKLNMPRLSILLLFLLSFLCVAFAGFSVQCTTTVKCDIDDYGYPVLTATCNGGQVVGPPTTLPCFSSTKCGCPPSNEYMTGTSTFSCSFPDPFQGSASAQVSLPAYYQACGGSTYGSCTVVETKCNFPCKESWTYSDWSKCTSSGVQTRAATDGSKCGTTKDRLLLSQKCTCNPDWRCGTWSECISEKQTRTCTDSNNCNTNSGKPDESESCKETVTSCATTTYSDSTVYEGAPVIMEITVDTASATVSISIHIPSSGCKEDCEAHADFLIDDSMVELYYIPDGTTLDRTYTFDVGGSRIPGPGTYKFLINAIDPHEQGKDTDSIGYIISHYSYPVLSRTIIVSPPCPSGTTCDVASGKCVLLDCDPPCEGSTVCDQKTLTCVSACDPPCAEDQTCDTATRTCKSVCNPECKGSAVCDPVQRQCVAGCAPGCDECDLVTGKCLSGCNQVPCDSSAVCDPVSGKCTKGCDAGAATCSGGSSCDADSGYCASPPIMVPGGGDSDGPKCSPNQVYVPLVGLCFDDCTTNPSQCKGGTSCNSNTKQCDMNCNNQGFSGCPSGTFCDSNGECAIDCSIPGANCAAGSVCDYGTGICKPGCDSDADCPETGFCNTATHLCEMCLQDSDCASNCCVEPAVAAGMSLLGFGSLASASSAEQTCAVEGEGVLIAASGSQKQCCPGLFLQPPSPDLLVTGIAGTCVQQTLNRCQSCTSDDQCERGTCNEGKCFICTSDGQCAAGACDAISGKCVCRQLGQSCAANSQCCPVQGIPGKCGAGGTCVYPYCLLDSDCNVDAGEICDIVTGRCLSPYSNEACSVTDNCVAACKLVSGSLSLLGG